MTLPMLLDLACEGVASALGTSSTISLSGTALSGGYLTWGNAGAVNGALYRFAIIDGANREEAVGVWNSSGNTFTGRATLIASVGGTKQTTPISVSASAVIGSTALAEDIITPGILLPNMLGGHINKFRNGTLDIWSRGTSGTSTTTAGPTTQTAADGWYVVPTGASATWAQAAGRKFTANSLKVTGATSVTDVLIKQRIESSIAAPLTSQNVTVQAQVFNNTGASITPTLTVKHAGTVDVWTSPTTDISAVSLQACANSAWTQVSYTFTDTGSASNGLEISIDFGNNFSTTGKYIQIAELDIRATPLLTATGQQANPPAPELRLQQIEFLICQRYLPSVSGAGQWGAYSVTYALISGGCASYSLSIAGGTNQVSFAVPPRIVPTGVAVSGQGGGTSLSTAFGSASLSVGIVSAMGSTGGGVGPLAWAGASSTSWAVFTGPEL